MKNIFCFLTVLLLGISCQRDPLDITPDGRVAVDAIFKNEKQTESYLNTVYSHIPSYFYKYQFYAFLAGTTDECQDADVGNESANIAANWITGSLTPAFNPLEIGGQGNGIQHYSNFWSGIRDANLFLANVETANIPIEKKRSRFKAEAQLLRAFYYLELVKQFGPMPLIANPLELSFDFSTLVRPTFQESINFIVQDCEAALANPDLPTRITLEVERGRFTKAIAHAIRSQALLYNASPLWNPENNINKWKAAAVASKASLLALTAGDEFQLYPDYESYFFSQSDVNTSPRDRETIFEIPDNSTVIFSNINTLPSHPGQFKAGSCPTQELVDSYDMQATGEPAILGYLDTDHLQPVFNPASGYDPAQPYTGRDPRFYATVWYNGASYDNIRGRMHQVETFQGGSDQLLRTPPNRKNTHTGYYLRKFYNPKVQTNQSSPARWKKYRLAEIYLNFAEAANEADGPTQEVYGAMNTIRARAKMPHLPVGLTKDQMRERIRRERRVELAIEEHRFWDVRRWKILDQTDKLVTGMEIIKNGNNLIYTRFVTERRNAWQDKYRIFPIPFVDASIIPDFSKNQNPGW